MRKARDLSSMFALFFIAVLANYVIIKYAPAIDVIEAMPDDQQPFREIGAKEAVLLTLGASSMLLLLYLFKDQM